MAMRGHCQHPGLDRHRHPVRPAARLPAAAGRRRAARDARLLRRARGAADRLLGQLPQVHRQPAQGVVRRRRHAGERLRLRLAAAHRRRLFAAAVSSTAWPRARSRVTSCSARTPAAAGRTPACTAPACATSTGSSSLDWFETESAVFWKSDPTGPPPAEIKTEVFFIPAAAAPEKEGSFTNTQRLLQWHDKAVDPPGDCRSDAWFVYNLGKRLKQLYAGSTDPRTSRCCTSPGTTTSTSRRACPTARSAGSRASRTSRRSCRRSTATSSTRSTRAPAGHAAERLLRAEGRRLDGVRLLDLQRRLPRAGPQPGRASASCTDNPLQPEWGFAWPHNRRILYNRASADPEGRPWSERKKLVWWDAEQRRWVGARSSPISSRTSRPTTGRRPARRAWTAIAGDEPFIMKPDGRRLAVRARGVKDGPLPTHYEPVESPVGNLLYPQQTCNPTVRDFRRPAQPARPHADGGVSRSSPPPSG